MFFFNSLNYTETFAERRRALKDAVVKTQYWSRYNQFINPGIL